MRIYNVGGRLAWYTEHGAPAGAVLHHKAKKPAEVKQEPINTAINEAPVEKPAPKRRGRKKAEDKK